MPAVWLWLISGALLVFPSRPNSETAAREPVETRSWMLAGPYSAYVARIAVDPRNADVVYMAADYELFQSEDGGQSWQPNRAVSYVPSVTLDPSRPDVVFVAGNGVRRSDDGGRTWAVMNAGLASLDTDEIAVAPSRPDTVYCHTSLDVYRSLSRGQTWLRLDGPWPGGASISWLRVDPRFADTVYVGVTEGLAYRTRDGGRHWAPIGLGLSSPVAPIAVDPTDSRILYSGGFKSMDGGYLWGPMFTQGWEAAVDPSEPSTLYLAGDEGVSKSTDAGRRWTFHGEGFPPAVFVQTLAVAPGSTSILYAGTSGDGVYRSDDGGVTWSPRCRGLTPVAVGSVAVSTTSASTSIYAGTSFEEHGKLYGDSGPTGSWIDVGPREGRALLPDVTVALDPRAPATLYVAEGRCYDRLGLCDGGLFRSLDAGLHWTRLRDESTIGVFLDPRNPAILYAIVQQYLANPAGLPPFLHAQHGVTSADGGATWSDVNLPSPTVLAFEAAGAGIFAGTAADGVFRSTDGGASWAPFSIGLPASAIRALAVNPRAGSTVFASTDVGVFRSTDSGSSWEATDLAIPAWCLVFDASPSPFLYAGTSDGVRRSGDGLRWRPVGGGLGEVRGLAIDPTGRRIWAATASGLFVWDTPRGPTHTVAR